MLFIVFIAAAVIPNIVNAYSIDANTTGSMPVSGSPGFSFGAAWNELTTPFQKFFNNLESVTPQDVSNFNPSGLPQMPSPNQMNWQSILAVVLGLFAWIFGLLKSLFDWLVSIVK